MTAFTEVNKSAVYSSCVASYQIAKQKKPHSIGEKSLMPVMKDVVKIMIGERESKILDSVSLSATTVKQRILDISHDILEQIISQVNTSPFYAIQLDKSTDFAGVPQLSLFIRYISNGEVLEKLLFCKPLQLHTRGEDIFKIIDGFFHDNSMSWDKCAGICTNRAAACTGINLGVVKGVKDEASNVQWTHCFLHRQALVAKSLSEELHDTLKCVNYIKARPLNQR